MKPYIEYLQEINKDEILEGLLAHGIFAEKIPPILYSQQFYKYCIDEDRTFEQKEKDYVRYESMRNINIPRLISIPNPFAYANLCKCIANNWDRIQSFSK